MPPQPIVSRPLKQAPLRERRIPSRSLLAEISEDMKARVVESINADLNVFEVTVVLNDTGERSGARALIILNYLTQNGQIIHSRPAVTELSNPDRFHGVLQVLIATNREVDQLRELALAEEVEKTSFASVAVDGLEVVTSEEAAARQMERTPAATGLAGAQKAARPGKEQKTLPTVRVTVDRLDYLMNLVAELVIYKTQHQQIISQFHQEEDKDTFLTRITEVDARLSRITSDLQEGIMKARMVQIGQVFFRFTRLVRDLSKSLGKQVELVIEGQETELDKTVIDEIGDPLMHLIRNSLDHGVEAPELRQKAGKAPKGILLLKASHAGDHIVVETADDGAGMDADKIRESAVVKGLISAAEAKTLTPSEAYALIFMPGFSTAQQVSSVSGRGVGMDVVKTTVENLGGEIAIKSEKGVGTSIQIKLPLTLAIIQGLLVQVGSEIFSVPLSTVKETILLQEAQIHMVNRQSCVAFRGEVVPLIYLNEFFDLAPAAKRRQFVVFAGVDENKVGLVVDALIGRREIVIKSLDKTFMDIKGFAGATVLGDGRVSLILDVPALMEESKRLRKVLLGGL